jgi:hypothetical protein
VALTIMMKQNVQKLNCTWLYYRGTRSLSERVKKSDRKKEKKTVDFFLSFAVLYQTACEQMVNDLSFTLSYEQKEWNKRTVKSCYWSVLKSMFALMTSQLSSNCQQEERQLDDWYMRKICKIKPCCSHHLTIETGWNQN